jgi:hypothetical protein
MGDSHENILRRRNFQALQLLLAALCVAPVALAQTPAGSSVPTQTAAPATSQTSSPEKSQVADSIQQAAQTQTRASSQAEPQMLDQSGPAAESLGEAARRARTQKTKAAAPKVYTEDSVSRLSGHGVSVVGDGSAEGGASASRGTSRADSEAQPSGGNQEQYWRGRARSIRDQMAQLDQQISSVRDEIAKYGAVQIDPQSGVQAGVIYIKDRNAQIERIEEQKTTLQGQLDALEEEGRKAGAESGWFR